MHKFVLNLLTEWRKLGLAFEGKPIVVGVSGGADSMSLALALADLKKRNKLKQRFVIAHLNHGLRGNESDEDERFVKKFAEKHSFELSTKSAKVSKTTGNIEQNAREARYNFLTETAKNLHSETILTAHTTNDQAETFLMNLIRGSGLSGLGGIRSIRPLSPENTGINVVRPLLRTVTRQMTEAFCRDCDVEYRYDSMNEDSAFQRVRIRKVLIPLLKDFNPKIIERLAKTSFLLQSDYEAFEKMADDLNELEQHYSKNGERLELKLKGIDALFPSIRQKLIRDWLKSQKGDLRALGASHLQAIENLIFSRKSGKVVELPNGDFVLKENGSLSFNKKKS